MADPSNPPFTEHIVKAGECLASIAAAYRETVASLWTLPADLLLCVYSIGFVGCRGWDPRRGWWDSLLLWIRSIGLLQIASDTEYIR